MQRIVTALILSLFTVLAFLPSMAQAAVKPNVYVVYVDDFQQIDPSVAQLIKRAFAEAEADPDGAAVVIVMDTPGGYVQSALDIQTVMLTSKMKSIVYVTHSAISAGALIGTAAEKLYMHPGSSIGAAEPRMLGSNEVADPKILTTVVQAAKSAAQARGRDEDIARAMVDRNARLPWQQDELLSLTAKDAVDRKFADGIASSLDDAIKLAGIAEYELVEITPSFSEQVGRFLTTPWVAILLLVVGVIAIGLEFMKPGLTFPGLIGVLCLGLFFMGNVLIGTAGWLELSLALIGVLLLIVEAFVPGFGIFGAGGVIAVGASIFLSAPTSGHAMQYLMFTAVAFAIALFGIVRAVSRRGLGKALTLSTDAQGWVPHRADLSGLVGMEGKALTILRPSGTALIGSDRVDVVADGDYLPLGARVKVIRVEGTRVVVRSVAE